MRRSFVAASAVVAVLASAAVVHAQTVNPRIAGAVAATIQARCERAGYASSSCINTVANASLILSGLGNLQSWIPVLEYLGFPSPVQLGEYTPGFESGGGSGGGGGVAATWCEDMEYRFDIDGNLIVPAMVLDTGAAVQPGSPSLLYWYWPGGADIHGAKTESAIARWYIHNYNLGLGWDKRYWFAPLYRSTSGSYVYSRPAFYDAGTKKVLAKVVNGFSARGYGTSTTANKPCPQAQNAGGDFHFYPRGDTGGTWPNCTMYSPNNALGESGYAIPYEGALAMSDVDAWLADTSGYAQRLCNIDRELIRRIADELYERAANSPTCSDCAPYQPVEEQDVRYDDAGQPQVRDLADNPTSLPQPTPTPTNTPTPTPTPTPSPSSSSSGDYTHPDVPEPSDPSLSLPDFDFDWGLPTLSLNLGSPPCPTYEFDAFENHFVLDVHCTFLEANRALIGALMVLGFTIGAAMVVLRS